MTLRDKMGFFGTKLGLSQLVMLLIIPLVCWMPVTYLYQERVDRNLATAIYHSDATAVRQALDSGANVEGVVVGTGIQPIQLASAYGSPAVITTLLDAGANINVDAANGGTPLSFAITNGQIAAVKLLLSRGADAKGVPSSDGSTPLSDVTTSTQMNHRQREEMAALLRKAGATK